MKTTTKRILSLVLATIFVASALALSSCKPVGGAAKIGVPDDATNLARAIKLLESAGFIEVDPAAGYSPELKHITKYIYNIELVPTTANTLASTLPDYAASIINGTYATSKGLVPDRDALIIENQTDKDNPYVNILAARSAEKDKAEYKTILEAFQTAYVGEYMLEKYTQAYCPAFEYEKPSQTGAEIKAEVDAYTSTKEGKTVVKVGVCGSSNDHWKAVQKILDDRNTGIYIELVEFDSYTLPNQALNEGDIDLNSFQHKAYFNKEVESNKYDITIIGDTLTAPLSLYSDKVDSPEALKELAGLKE